MDMGNEHERADAGLRAEEQRAREVLKSENVKHADERVTNTIIRPFWHSSRRRIVFMRLKGEAFVNF